MEGKPHANNYIFNTDFEETSHKNNLSSFFDIFNYDIKIFTFKKITLIKLAFLEL